MKYFKILTCVLTTLIIASCNTANVKHQAFNSVTKPVTRQDSALVYVYRHKKGTEYTLGTVNITVNNKYSFGLKDSRFTYIYLTPGPHTFKASWSLWDKPLFEGGQFDSKTTTYNFEAGKRYYINYFINDDKKPATLLEQQSIVGKALSKSHIISAGLILEKESIALNSLSFCFYFTNDFN